MPSLAELRKSQVTLSYRETLSSLNFTLGPGGFWFYRRRGKFLDVIDIWRKSSGNWIKFAVIVTVDEMVSDYNMEKFPKGFSKHISNPLSKYITKKGVQHGWHAWNVSNANNLEETFTTVTKLVTTNVDDWMKSIDDPVKLYENISDSVKDGPGGEEIRKILLKK